MAAYCDTNFLLRLYSDLPEHDEVERLLARQSEPVPITWLHQVEVPNALQHMVLLARTGTSIQMTPENALLGLTRFEDELSAGNRLLVSPLPTHDVVRQARELSLRHTAKHGFRAYDVLHVACALLLECDRFWSFDLRAGKLARIEGLRTL
jgi:predicted nucleic acid-binding protein